MKEIIKRFNKNLVKYIENKLENCEIADDNQFLKKTYFGEVLNIKWKS